MSWMRSKFQKVMHKLQQIKFNKQRIALLLILVLFLAILFNFRLGSITEPFNQSENQPKRVGNPDEQQLPENNGNLPEQFENPENLPPELIGQIGDGTRLPDEDDDNGDDGPLPEPPPGPSPGPGNDTGNGQTDPDPPTRDPLPQPQPNPGDNENDPNQGQGAEGRPEIGLPQGPNKARNLPKVNLSLNFDQFGINIDFQFNVNVDTSYSKIGFSSVLLMVFMMNYYFVPSLMSTINKIEEEDDQQRNQKSSIFIKPKQLEQKEKIPKERLRQLTNLQNRINYIIANLNKNIGEKPPNKLIVETYHKIDKALIDFSSIKRSKNLTPLEHSRQLFDSKEVDHDKLEKIVDLFYLARYGEKEMDEINIKQIIEALRQFVKIDVQVTD